ncbi:MAG: hypothetical protein ABFD52_09310 [Acidobacteriota bacterium]
MDNTRRKNLRGLPQRLKAIVDRIAKAEFEEMGPTPIITGAPPGITTPDSDYLAFWRIEGAIEFNTLGGREWFLQASDEQLEQIVRHELLHGLLWQRGEPNGDTDLPFIIECAKRNILVNESSI